MTRYSAGFKGGPMLPAANPRVSAQTAGTPAGTLSPRGAMTGGGRPAPTSALSALSGAMGRVGAGAMTGGGRPASISSMKKGGAIAKKAAPKKR